MWPTARPFAQKLPKPGNGAGRHAHQRSQWRGSETEIFYCAPGGRDPGCRLMLLTQGNAQAESTTTQAGGRD